MKCEPLQIVNTKGCALGMMLVKEMHDAHQPALDALRLAAEAALRAAHGGCTSAALRQVPPFDAYAAYYRQFGSTYHVASQVASVAGGKSIPVALPPVAVMFIAELQNGVLTAAHDHDALRLPLDFRQADGTECYIALNGREVHATRSDYLLADAAGVVSSILRGPDQRTAVTGDTKNVLYVAYAPHGVALAGLESHFASMQHMLSQVYQKTS